MRQNLVALRGHASHAPRGGAPTGRRSGSPSRNVHFHWHQEPSRPSWRRCQGFQRWTNTLLGKASSRGRTLWPCSAICRTMGCAISWTGRTGREWTGMRKGEIAALTWEAFDRETWTLRLHAKSAKSGRGRLLALEGPLREIIERRIKLPTTFRATRVLSLRFVSTHRARPPFPTLCSHELPVAGTSGTHVACEAHVDACVPARLAF